MNDEISSMTKVKKNNLHWQWIIIIVVILVLFMAIRLPRGNTTTQSGQPVNKSANGVISKENAVSKVKALPEVADYLKRVPNGIVEVDNELEGKYNVHVYEVKNGHTATFNWYRVYIKSGEIRTEF